MLYNVAMAQPVYADTGPTEMSSTQLRERVSEVIALAKYNKRITYVTRNGQRMAAIVPPDVIDEMRRLENALDASLVDAAMDRIAAGQEEVISWEQAKEELGL